MAIISALAIAGAGLMGYSAYASYKAGQDQKDALNQQAAANRQIQSEQRAINAQKQNDELRQQFREERIRRAMLLQQSETTGTSGSSGESGGIFGMGTQLASNVGSNLGMAAAGNRISGYAQQAADFGLAAQNAAINAQKWNSLFQMGATIFSASGGFKSGTPAQNQGAMNVGRGVLSVF